MQIAQKGRHHNASEGANKAWQAMQASIDEAKTQLNEYQNLPPDFNDAKLKLDTMRAQIKRLDEEIENKFGVLD